MLAVVGTVEGGRAPTKIKTDLKKPVVNLACHPRLPLLVNKFNFILDNCTVSSGLSFDGVKAQILIRIMKHLLVS